jgi:hypothetical protein
VAIRPGGSAAEKFVKLERLIAMDRKGVRRRATFRASENLLPCLEER